MAALLVAVPGRGAAATLRPSLLGVVDSHDLTTSLKADATDQSSDFAKLTRLVTAASYVAGLGFVMAAILKFKQHKDNPTQLVLGRPVQFVFLGAALPYLDYFLAQAGAHLFAQDQAGQSIAVVEEKQAFEDPHVLGVPQSPALSAEAPSSSGLFAVLTRERVDESGLVRAAGAELTAVHRSSVALETGNHRSYEQEKAAVATDLGHQAMLLSEVVALRHTVSEAFRALQLGVHITHTGMLTLARYVRSHGLRGIRRGIERRGVRPSSAGLRGVSAAQLATQFSAPGSRFDLSQLFVDSGRQDAADRHLATLLGRAASAVTRLP